MKLITPNSQIKFKATMLYSSLCDYSDAYIIKGRIPVAAAAVTTANNNK